MDYFLFLSELISVCECVFCVLKNEQISCKLLVRSLTKTYCCFPRILLILSLHTVNNMQTALTGNGKGKIIWPCSQTVKCHCWRERNILALKLRYNFFFPRYLLLHY